MENKIKNNMAKANRSDLDAWNVDEQRQRQRALQLELVEKLKRRQDAGETLLSQQEIDWFKGRPITDEEINKLRKRFKNNTIQTKPDLIRAKLKPNKTWWTETKLWTVSGIIVMAILLSAVYFTKALLIICLVSLVAIFVGLLVAGIYVLIKDALGLDDK